jgi:hypothetical protein
VDAPAGPANAAAALAILPNTIDKRMKVMSMIDAASTPQELQQLMTDFDGDVDAQNNIAMRWAAMDPVGCLAYVKQRTAGDVMFPQTVRMALFRVWTEKDPTAAMEAAMGIGLNGDFQTASLNVVEAALQKDLKLGSALLAQRGKLPDIYSFPEDLWRVDPAGFVQALLPPGTVADKNLSFAMIEPLNAWSVKDPAGTLKWLQTLTPEALTPVLLHTVAGLVNSDPQAAVKLIATLPSTAAREAASAALTHAWVQTDPASAFTYALTVGIEKPAKNLKTMASLVAEKGSAALLNAYNSMPAGKLKNQLIPILAHEWLDTDPKEASRFLASLPPGQERVDAIKQLSIHWAENSPNEALNFVRINNGPEMREVTHKIITRRAAEDPTTTVNWVMNLPEAQALPALRASFNAISTEYQMEDATKLVAVLPTQNMKVEAVRSFMEPFGTGQRLYDEGLKWAAALPTDLRAVARETLLSSPLISTGERDRTLQQLK